MGEGRKGWTFRLSFRSPERTPTSEEAQEQQDAVVAAVRARCEAELQGLTEAGWGRSVMSRAEPG